MNTDQVKSKEYEFVAYDERNPDFPLGFGNSIGEARDKSYINVGDVNFDKNCIKVVRTEDCIIENFPNKFEVKKGDK